MKHYTYDPSGDWNGKTVVCLPGRGGHATELAIRYAKQSILGQFKVIGIQPDNEWYPIPRGPKDQKEAVQGLVGVAVELNCYLSNLFDEEKISKYQTALVGYSAGGVVAIQAASMAAWNYPYVVVHSGCVLDPEILPERSINILMYHCKDDTCFGWNERYQPSTKALSQKGYRVLCKERETGGHSLPDKDIYDAAMTIFVALDTPD